MSPTPIAVVCRTRTPGPAHRVRTVLLDPVTGTTTIDEHVRTRLPSGARWSKFADVLIERGAGEPVAAARAATHPGVLVIAVHQGAHCWLRLGPEGVVRAFRSRVAPESADVWEALASSAHAWLVAGRPAARFGSAPLRVLGVHPSGMPLSSSRSRRLTDSASFDRARPAEE